MAPHLRFTVDDLWLFLMVNIWALNLTVLKVVFREMTPLAFNAARFTLASLVFAGLIAWLEGGRRLWIEGADLPKVVLLGLMGHTGYQLCFVLGLHLTTATHAGLIFGTTPLVIAVLSTLKGHERLAWPIWAGLASSATGVILTVSGRQVQGGRALSTLGGDALLLLAVLLWALYTVHSKPMLGRYSPLRLTGLSMIAGTVPLVLIALPACGRLDWGAVGWLSWGGLGYSAFLAVVLSYLIWYRSVARVGSARTAVYGNLVPVLGPLFAVWLLREPLTGQLALGGGCIVTGIILTRVRVHRPAAPLPRAEFSV